MGRGIKVNAILPNAIRTPLAGTAPAKVIESLIAPQTIKRMGEPGEVGYAAAFLISVRALFVTGTSLPVDGGFFA
ncbi:SDR family oxidoreductase [Pseudarthrobacter sp. SL88]|uniref:SDR family oxidoreductase n=1 Tax=Pseudarthrobacter sp. SL88 TaxID=2994666 RepID=UPI0022725160|nr:SDR family oxidoreductase [Pseudarthrobacter sp. SL88]MCY1674972.1 SDR family oxidoreductase [Pseudarthrobacter sp. SL88]